MLDYDDEVIMNYPEEVIMILDALDNPHAFVTDDTTIADFTTMGIDPSLDHKIYTQFCERLDVYCFTENTPFKDLVKIVRREKENTFQ